MTAAEEKQEEDPWLDSQRWWLIGIFVGPGASLAVIQASITTTICLMGQCH
ncbi:MAG: hypothetical protein VB858_15485 [Planctomycetaceae bacterium]